MLEINKKNGITIPGFPGMFEGGVHTRFGKRIDFDSIPSHKDISDQYVRDMQDKMVRTQRDFNLTRESEKEIIRNLKEQIAGDKRRKYELLMRKRDDFIRENHSFIQAKKEKKDREKQDYKEYKLNFFPFTYGE